MCRSAAAAKRSSMSDVASLRDPTDDRCVKYRLNSRRIRSGARLNYRLSQFIRRRASVGSYHIDQSTLLSDEITEAAN